MSGDISHTRPPDVAPGVVIGPDHRIDAGVVIGYLPGRKVARLETLIGAGCVIRTGTVIYAGVEIGDGLETGHNVVIREENRIGHHLSIWNNSAIDYGCTIGSNVRIHNNVYICQNTIIEDDVFIAPGVMMANDRYPVNRLGLKGPVLRRGAKIGINVTLLPEVVIGEGALIGSGSVVTKDVPAFTIAYGNPASVHRDVPRA